VQLCCYEPSYLLTELLSLRLLHAHLQKLRSCSDKVNWFQLCCLYTLMAASAAAVSANPTHALQLF
jgi:hypothetical protein